MIIGKELITLERIAGSFMEDLQIRGTTEIDQEVKQEETITNMPFTKEHSE